MGERADHVGCRTAGGQSHNDVVRRNFYRPQVSRALRRRILRALDGVRQRPPPPCNHRLHQPRRHTKRRRTFRRIERGQPAAGACAHVDEPAAAADGANDRVHGACDPGQLTGNRRRHRGVLAIDDA